MTDNPFLLPFTTPHQTLPFHLIRNEHYEPAMRAAMDEEMAEVEAIAANPEQPTFRNTIVALAESGERLARIQAAFYNQLSAYTNDALDEISLRMAPVLTQHANDIMLNEQLFARVKMVYDGYRKENAAPLESLSAEESMLLDNTYKSFVRRGALLSGEQKEEFRQLSAELSRLTLQFSQNKRHDTQAFILHLTSETDVAGLPKTRLEAAHDEAVERKLEGWVVTLNANQYGPFLMYSTRRELRQQLYLAYNSISNHGDDYDNKELVRTIVNQRLRMAQLLGHDTYADYVLEERMAGSASQVYGLLDELFEAYQVRAKQDVADVEALAKRLEGPDFQLMPWDFAFYANKLKEELYAIDSEQLRPFFELHAVKRGIFGLATTLYGLSFRPSKEISVYEESVEAYEVYDRDGSFKAVLYCDFYPRPNKKSGAWMTVYAEQSRKGVGDQQVEQRPHVAIVMNLTKPTSESPSLLTLSEVETFLHEFGHALHGMLADTTYAALSGTNVYWDFVELPSQVMENFSTENVFLDTFARHYQTGEMLPPEWVERIRKARTYNAAYQCLRQLSFGYLDMAYYTRTTVLPDSTDIPAYEQAAWQRCQLLPTVEASCMSVQFSHIISGGYAAGYYSYKWAEVLDADAYSALCEDGEINHEAAERFRSEVLSRGGTEDPMTLYVRFRGARPNIEALLHRDGIK